MGEYKTVIDFLSGHYITCNGVLVCHITDEELVHYVNFSEGVMRSKQYSKESKERALTIYIQNLIINARAA